MEACKSGMPCFSCRSLLLSTTILNDITTVYLDHQYILKQVARYIASLLTRVTL